MNDDTLMRQLLLRDSGQTAKAIKRHAQRQLGVTIGDALADRVIERRRRQRCHAVEALRWRALVASYDAKSQRWVRRLPRRGERYAVNGRIFRSPRTKVQAGILHTVLGMRYGCPEGR